MRIYSIRPNIVQPFRQSPAFGNNKLSVPNIDYFIKHKFPLTKFDTSEILELRLQCFNAKIYTKKDAEYINNIERILKEQFRLMSEAKSDKKMVILVGFPGCGKNEYIKKNYNKDYYLADTDEVKKMFPAYEREGKRLNNLHKLSSDIIKEQIIPEALKNKKNIVIPTTAHILGVEELAVLGKNSGYNVKLIFMDTNKDLCIQRTLDRYHRDGRFIDPYFFETRGPYLQNIDKNFINSPLIDEIVVLKDYTV